MTTKIYSDRHKSSHLIPALGESWGHAPTHRLLLHWGKTPHSGKRASNESLCSSRLATIFKSPSRPEQSVAYRVTSGGVRDVEAASEPDLDSIDEMDDVDFEKSAKSYVKSTVSGIDNKTRKRQKMS